MQLLLYTYINKYEWTNVLKAAAKYYIYHNLVQVPTALRKILYIPWTYVKDKIHSILTHSVFIHEIVQYANVAIFSVAS